jgi:transcriptional regulator with XRE-family HTH domain
MNRKVKKIRDALGLSQVEFGRKIGRSLASVQGYEAGREISPPAQKAIVQLAQEGGLGDLCDDFLAEREEIAPGLPIVGRPDTRTAHLHDLLDAVLASGQDEPIRAVRAVLETFARQVRANKRR